MEHLLKRIEEIDNYLKSETDSIKIQVASEKRRQYLDEYNDWQKMSDEKIKRRQAIIAESPKTDTHITNDNDARTMQGVDIQILKVITANKEEYFLMGRRLETGHLPFCYYIVKKHKRDWIAFTRVENSGHLIAFEKVYDHLKMILKRAKE